MHRTVLCAVTLALLVVGVLEATEPRPTPYDRRLRYLIEWIAARTDYSADVPLPRMVFLSSEQINNIYYSKREPGYRGQQDIYALYDRGRYTILLPFSFDIRRDEAFLVHELVHHLQTTHRRRFRCDLEREREAYLIQRRYVQETGIGLMPETAFIMQHHCYWQ